MYIIAIAWIYVVLMMALTETSIVAGVMTFLTYCVVPLSIILYLIGTPQRKRRRDAARNLPRDISETSSPTEPSTMADPAHRE